MNTLEWIIFGLVMAFLSYKMGTQWLPKLFKNNKPTREEIDERIHSSNN